MQFMKVVVNNYLKDSRGNYNPQDKIIVTYWLLFDSKWRRIPASEYLFAENKHSGNKTFRQTEEFVKNTQGQCIKNITRFYKSFSDIKE